MYLMLRDSFNQSIANVLSPNSILSMMLSDCANQCMAFAQLPSSLLGMTCGDCLSQNMEIVLLPSSILRMMFGDSVNLSMASVHTAMLCRTTLVSVSLDQGRTLDRLFNHARTMPLRLRPAHRPWGGMSSRRPLHSRTSTSPLGAALAAQLLLPRATALCTTRSPRPTSARCDHASRYPLACKSPERSS